MTQKPPIQFETLQSLDVRLCRIEQVEDILKNPKKPPAEDNPVKAYKLTIDTGFDKRECVTNLINYTPDALRGLVLPFILNLPEAEIRGVKSTAMVVAASAGDKVGLLIETGSTGIGAVVF